MSYHQTLGAASSIISSAIPKPKCPPGTTPHWTKSGYVCGGGSGGGASISLPTTVSVSTSGRITGSATASTSASSGSSAPAAPAPSAAMSALLVPGATSYKMPTTNWTLKPAAPAPTETERKASATVATQEAERAAGMNWLPWVLGAAGIGAIVWLARSRS